LSNERQAYYVLLLKRKRLSCDITASFVYIVRYLCSF